MCLHYKTEWPFVTEGVKKANNYLLFFLPSTSSPNLIRANENQLIFTQMWICFPHSNLWHIPLTYINDSCSNSISCKQMFYLKDKTGK